MHAARAVASGESGASLLSTASSGGPREVLLPPLVSLALPAHGCLAVSACSQCVLPYLHGAGSLAAPVATLPQGPRSLQSQPRRQPQVPRHCGYPGAERLLPLRVTHRLRLFLSPSSLGPFPLPVPEGRAAWRKFPQMGRNVTSPEYVPRGLSKLSQALALTPSGLRLPCMWLHLEAWTTAVPALGGPTPRHRLGQGCL